MPRPLRVRDWPQRQSPAIRRILYRLFPVWGAPYWDSGAKAVICGITRTTGKAEIVRAALESIAYQITDIVSVMEKASGMRIEELRVDGGPTKNGYRMQFQSDQLGIPVRIPESEELSGIGAAYAAGLSAGIFEKKIFEKMQRTSYNSKIERCIREQRYQGWKDAVKMIMAK